jgi:hypothetical protein
MSAPELGVPFRDAEWPHGLRCTACSGLFHEGESYTTRLYAFVGDSPLLEVVCVPCATSSGSQERRGRSARRP